MNWPASFNPPRWRHRPGSVWLPRASPAAPDRRGRRTVLQCSCREGVRSVHIGGKRRPAPVSFCDGCPGNSLDSGAIGGRRRIGRKQHSFPSRKNLRQKMTELPIYQFGHWRRISSIGGNPNHASEGSPKKDAGFTPGGVRASGSSGDSVERHHRAAIHRDLVHLAAREKPDPTPIRREEWRPCPFRTGEFRGVGLVQPPYEELSRAAGDARQISGTSPSSGRGEVAPTRESSSA